MTDAAAKLRQFHSTTPVWAKEDRAVLLASADLIEAQAERIRVLREAVQNSIDASDAASAEMATKLIAQGITSIPISDLTAKAYEAAGALRAALEATK